MNLKLKRRRAERKKNKEEEDAQLAASKKLLLLLLASAPAEASAVNSIKEEVDSVDAITYSEKLVNGDDNNIKSVKLI